MLHVAWATVVWAALSTSAPTVEVRSERVHLGHLVSKMPEPWASVDLGAAPEPLQSRTVTADDIAEKIINARLAPAPVAVPQRTRVRRAGTTIAEPELRSIIQDAVANALPNVFALRSLSINGGIVLGAGQASITLGRLEPREGKQTVFVTLGTEDGISRMVPALLDLHRTVVDAAPVMERGQDITIVLIQGNVRLQSTGTAQAPGAVGDVISVMPTSGTRVLRGRVIDNRTVEVNG